MKVCIETQIQAEKWPHTKTMFVMLLAEQVHPASHNIKQTTQEYSTVPYYIKKDTPLKLV